MVEIQDEFGRTRLVPRNSNTYQQHMREQEVQREVQRAKDRIFGGRSDDGRGGGSGSDSCSGSGSGGTQWAWSRGENHNSTADWLKDIAEERGIKALVEDRVEKEVVASFQLSDAARVKTQFEKVLNNSAREYLDDVHREVEAFDGGRGGESKRLEDRRELLRLKKLQRTAGQF